MLHPLDIAVIVGWLVFTMAAGAWFSRKASESTESYLVGARNLPWWVVGTSMVATTFAADTPLAVSGFVAGKGIAENWLWWTDGVAGAVAVFLFAPLWRRSAVLTDAELVELRYPGRAGAWLRGIKAAWFGVFFNLLVIAWVMRSAAKITKVVFGFSDTDLLLGMPADVTIICTLLVLTVAYTASAGLLGVVATDLAQFIVAITASIALAWLAWGEVGGASGAQLAFAEHDGFDWQATTLMLPLGDTSPDGATAGFLALVGLVWWSKKNTDGGGYLAQRLLAAKDETHALGAYLWFVVAHICLRPWPWILVGIAGMAILGPQDDPETYYPQMMQRLLSPGWFGLMLASFLAAFMSTIDTQLHWGAGLVVNDGYKRFVAPNASDAHHLMATRLAVLGLAGAGAIVSFAIDDIGWAWKAAISVTVGVGTVYMARWYWWRVTAWAELSTMVVALLGTVLFSGLHSAHPLHGGEASWLASVPPGWLTFPFSAAFTGLVSLPVWIAVALLTSSSMDRDKLRDFYRQVRPGGPGWAEIAGELPGFERDGPTRHDALGILGAVLGIYGVLLGVGGLLLAQPIYAIGGVSAAVIGIPLALLQVRRRAALAADRHSETR